MTHGASAYANQKCRCSVCTSEHSKGSRKHYWSSRHDEILAQKNKKRRERYANDPVFRAKRQAEAKQWIKNNYGRWLERTKKSYHRHRPRIIKERAAKRHGISVELYESLLQIHKGCCGICGKQCPTKRSLAVDHDHKTGVVRGLLCCNCNLAIGQFGDNPKLLRQAADYLERFFTTTKGK